MEISGRYVSKLVIGVAVVVILALAAGAVYLVTKGSSNKNSSGNNAPTLTLPPAATQAPTIATGNGAAGKVTGFKLKVQVQPVPEIQSGKWAVSVAVQGGKNRSQTLGQERLDPSKPFVISNNATGAYTITPSILNCSKDCSPTAKGYTLPPLTVEPKKNAIVVITAKCVSSPLPLGINCTRSQVSASYTK